jgi:dipeptidyl aminopeptidase/acylaminoacyl peptidase
MPGHGLNGMSKLAKIGVEVMDDYLSAIDDVNYVDKNRLGCVGASYGGYSAFT